MKIFYDVDTQKDFMNKDGALYVPDAELIKPNLKLLTDYAREKGIFLAGSMDFHFGIEEYKEREGELQRNGGPFPDHCMHPDYFKGKSDGIVKINETDFKSIRHPHFLNESVNLGTLNNALVDNAIIFEKQSYDVFTNPAFESFLKYAEVDEAVVYGVATDYCVKAAVLGMQKLGVQCYVVEDAIKGVDSKTTDSALEEMLSPKVGAKLVTTKDVLK